MSYKFLHRIIAGIVFLISAVQYFMTVQPSVSFWDPGELSAAAYALEVPHPPGGPLFSLVGHIFYMLPFPGNIGFRMNAVSVLSATFTVLFLYLIAVRLIRIYKGAEPQNSLDAYGTYIAAAIGALSFSFCDTPWFNAAESNYFAASTVLFSAIFWLILVWYEKSEDPGSWKYVLVIAYLVGLSTGVHLMSVLAFFTVVMLIALKRNVTDDAQCKKSAWLFLGHAVIILAIGIMMANGQTSNQPPTPDEFKSYDTDFVVISAIVSAVYIGIFRKKIFNRNSFYLPLAIAAVALVSVYPGIIKKLPSFLLLIADDSSSTGVMVVLFLLVALAYAAYWSNKKKKIILAVTMMAAVLIIIGFTTYSMTIIRAGHHPPMNENNPNSFSRLVSYLNREQYGDFPMFKRRWSTDPQHQTTWSNYSSDLDFFLRYQMNHMFNRYIGWNFIGRSSFIQDAGVDVKQLFGIPFLVGICGLWFHFRKDWKMASVVLTLFMFMGYLTAFYQNQQEWQPRDRDYFYGGAYFVFAIWIALGVRGFIDIVQQRITEPGKAMPFVAGILAITVILIPGRMLQTNYFTHDRSKNWLPWDYSYNLLQSCRPNSVLFTNGDNDTFPLWYLQDVEGIRRDIRIVNLSLVNTEWYIKQLKHEAPYGTPPVKISLSDDIIDRISPMRWDAQKITLAVPPDTLRAYNVTDTAVLKSGAITFTMVPTLHVGDVGGIRVQDAIVREIVLNNAWKRPIYFANTCGDNTKIGLSDYIREEGYAGRLIPLKKSSNPNVHYFVDEALMERNLLAEHATVSKSYQPGYLFRGLNDKSIFFDENSERMALNSRGSFMMLATAYLYGDGDKAKCVRTLDRMEQVISRSVIRMDFRQQYEIGMMYAESGEQSKFNEIAKEVEQISLAKIDDPSNSQDEVNNAYQILTDLYERTQQYSKAAELLEKLVPSYPNDPSLKQEIQKYKGLAAGQKGTQPSK